eukprot:gene6525-9965_t
MPALNDEQVVGLLKEARRLAAQGKAKTCLLIVRELNKRDRRCAELTEPIVLGLLDQRDPRVERQLLEDRAQLIDQFPAAAGVLLGLGLLLLATCGPAEGTQTCLPEAMRCLEAAARLPNAPIAVAVKAGAGLDSARALCFSRYHYSMVNDAVRNGAFRDAIRAAAADAAALLGGRLCTVSNEDAGHQALEGTSPSTVFKDAGHEALKGINEDAGHQTLEGTAPSTVFKDAGHNAVEGTGGGVHIVDIGSGTGLLSCYALDAVANGANVCVTAFEANPVFAEMSRAVAVRGRRAAGKPAVSAVVPRLSTECPAEPGPGPAFPADAAVIVTETLDCAVFGEGIVPTLADALRKVRPAAGGRLPIVVPRAADLWGCVVASGELAAASFVVDPRAGIGAAVINPNVLGRGEMHEGQDAERESYTAERIARLRRPPMPLTSHRRLCGYSTASEPAEPPGTATPSAGAAAVSENACSDAVTCCAELNVAGATCETERKSTAAENDTPSHRPRTSTCTDIPCASVKAVPRPFAGAAAVLGESESSERKQPPEEAAGASRGPRVFFEEVDFEIETAGVPAAVVAWMRVDLYRGAALSTSPFAPAAAPSCWEQAVFPITTPSASGSAQPFRDQLPAGSRITARFSLDDTVRMQCAVHCAAPQPRAPPEAAPFSERTYLFSRDEVRRLNDLAYWRHVSGELCRVLGAGEGRRGALARVCCDGVTWLPSLLAGLGVEPAHICVNDVPVAGAAIPRWESAGVDIEETRGLEDEWHRESCEASWLNRSKLPRAEEDPPLHNDPTPLLHCSTVVQPCGLLEERGVVSLRRERATGGRNTFPANVKLYFFGVESAELLSQTRVSNTNTLGVDVEGLMNAYSSSIVPNVDIHTLPHTRLVDPFGGISLIAPDRPADDPDAAEALLFEAPVVACGTLHALPMFFTLHYSEAATFTTMDPSSHFKLAAHILPAPLPVTQGQTLKIRESLHRGGIDVDDEAPGTPMFAASLPAATENAGCGWRQGVY